MTILEPNGYFFSGPRTEWAIAIQPAFCFCQTVIMRDRFGGQRMAGKGAAHGDGIGHDKGVGVHFALDIAERVVVQLQLLELGQRGRLVEPAPLRRRLLCSCWRCGVPARPIFWLLLLSRSSAPGLRRQSRLSNCCWRDARATGYRQAAAGSRPKAQRSRGDSSWQEFYSSRWSLQSLVVG